MKDLRQKWPLDTDRIWQLALYLCHYLPDLTYRYRAAIMGNFYHISVRNNGHQSEMKEVALQVLRKITAYPFANVNDFLLWKTL